MIPAPANATQKLMLCLKIGNGTTISARLSANSPRSALALHSGMRMTAFVMKRYARLTSFATKDKKIDYRTCKCVNDNPVVD
jgi:hypothetical protein